MTKRGLGIALVSALACGGGPQGPVSGDLLISYHPANTEAGAMVLTISGGAVESVTGLGGQQVSFTSPLQATTRVVVLGNFVAGEMLRIRVPDVSLVASYVVRVDQVAHKTTFALISGSQHTFTVHRPSE